MNKSTSLATALGLATLALASAPVAQACGDKLTVLGGGIPFEKIHTNHRHGSLVMYLSPDSRLSAFNNDARLDQALTRDGHQVKIGAVERRTEAGARCGPGRLRIDRLERGEAAAAECGCQRADRPGHLRDDAAERALVQSRSGCVVQSNKRHSREMVHEVEALLENRVRTGHKLLGISTRRERLNFVPNTGGGRAPWLALTAGWLWAGVGQAQAWLPSAGSGDVSVAYVDSWYTKHWTSSGGTVDAGHIRAFTYALGAEYSPTDRWMFSASLPLIESEYHGAHPHPTEVDDGAYHATFTDLRTEAHYQWLLEPFAIAPYVAYLFPVRNYETLGHAAPGRGLDDLGGRGGRQVAG